MSQPYLCPKCKTNRTRFHQIVQEVRPVKLDPHTGEVAEQFSNDTLDAFHMQYNGPDMRIQCGACGLNEMEECFITFAKNDAHN